MSKPANETQPPSTPCAYEGCSESAWSESPDGLCLYHAPQNEKDQDTAKEVWQYARRKAAAPDGCSFAGWHFPRDPDGKRFDGLVFAGSAVFSKASFQGIASFSESTFQNIVDFSDTVFEYIANFSKATFVLNASFIGASFRGKVMFFETLFQSDAMFHMATFKGVAEFSKSTFQGYAAFCRVNFQHYAWFSGTNFHGEAEFSGAIFQNNARFARAQFHGDAEFSGANFQGDAVFSGAGFRADARFIDAFFRDGRAVLVDLPSWSLPWRQGRPFYRREQGELLYRMAKEACRKRGDYRHAGQFHYAEQCAIESGRRKACGPKPWKGRFWSCLLELGFARILFGYGEKPHRVLVIAVLFILCWAGLYFFFAGIVPSNLYDQKVLQYEPQFAECLHFSAVTFTTLGYGDLIPKPGFRFWADMEALSGAALMALFVVGLTRKYVL
ncbi:MAG: pentapeptide repeat-containing protein [Phycisphaerae bacterium]|nr:pentapeptide repeat-containing protein [Phycisphaerae bacterium]